MKQVKNDKRKNSQTGFLKICFRTRRFRQAFFSILGAVIYGLWTYLINRKFGEITAIRAMFAQSTLSFVSTLFLSNLIEIIGAKSSKNILLFFSIPWIIPIAIVVGIMIFFHYISGTPRIAMTVAPSAIIGTIYSLFYLITFRKSIYK
jgi:hypothetical protein